MKRLIITAIACITITMTVMAKSRLFSQCENIKNVSTTFIGKAMMRHAATSLIGHGIAANAVNAGLEEVTIISTENPQSATQVKKILKDYESSQKFELIMESQDEGSVTRILQGQSPDGKYEFLLISEDDDDLTIVVLQSSQSFDTLQGIFMPGIVK